MNLSAPAVGESTENGEQSGWKQKGNALPASAENPHRKGSHAPPCNIKCSNFGSNEVYADGVKLCWSGYVTTNEFRARPLATLSPDTHRQPSGCFANFA